MDFQSLVTHQIDLLTTYRGNLHHLIEQAALYGSESKAPIPIMNDIRQARYQIRRIKELLQSYNISFPHDPDDEPQVQSLISGTKVPNLREIIYSAFVCFSSIDDMYVHKLDEHLRQRGHRLLLLPDSLDAEQY